MKKKNVISVEAPLTLLRLYFSRYIIQPFTNTQASKTFGKHPYLYILANTRRHLTRVGSKKNRCKY